MTSDQRRAFIDASNRRLARLKAQTQAEIQAAGLTEQEWIARQRAAYEVAQVALKESGREASQTPGDAAKE